jgi:OOP family OmpA-OmpF porin
MTRYFTLIALAALALTACATPPVKPENIFRVYFDPGKANLCCMDKQAIADAANAYQNGGQEIILAGHTDRSGSKELNTQLSKDRAVAVTAALVKAGVPRERIVTRYFGESSPYTKAGDGVASSQDRRVLMIVR